MHPGKGGPDGPFRAAEAVLRNAIAWGAVSGGAGAASTVRMARRGVKVGAGEERDAIGAGDPMAGSSDQLQKSAREAVER